MLRDNYNTEVRLKMRATPCNERNPVESTTGTDQSSLFAFPPATKPDYELLDSLGLPSPDLPALSEDDLAQELLEHIGEEAGTRLLRQCDDAFPLAYREDYRARSAVRHRRNQAAAGWRHCRTPVPPRRPPRLGAFKLIRLGQPISLSACRCWKTWGAGAGRASLRYLPPTARHGLDQPISACRLDEIADTDISHNNFSEPDLQRGGDGLNKLVVLAGLEWRRDRARPLPPPRRGEVTFRPTSNNVWPITPSIASRCSTCGCRQTGAAQ